MNYIKEINAFYDHMECNPLSASAVTLWHTLMHINNKARWAETFTVAAPVIRMKSGLRDSSFKRARTELKEKGYIDYQSRSRNQAPVYRMVRLSGGEEGSAEETEPAFPRSIPNGKGTGQLVSGSMDHLEDLDAGALNKQKEVKQKTTNKVDSVSGFFKENFSAVSPYVNRELIHWVNKMGEQMVMYAMKRALERGKTNWSYVRAILENWEKKEIFSLREVQEEELRFRRGNSARKMRGSTNVRYGKNEVVPDWFWERRRGKGTEQDNAKEQGLSQEIAEESEEIRRMLRELG